MNKYDVYNERFTRDDDTINYVEIDENIAIIISMLNKKGYITEYCCSGHMLGDLFDKHSVPKGFDINESYIKKSRNCYILFREKYKFSDLPFGFHSVDFYGDRTCIEYEFVSSSDSIARHTEIYNVMMYLYVWVREL